mgnify:CR=1 FL=1
MSKLSQFIKLKRKSENLTQEELSLKAGVGLRFIRDLEQGKETLKMDKVNLVLSLFGHELSPTKINKDETR